MSEPTCNTKKNYHTLSIVVSVLALLVSLVSAFYTRQQVKLAAKASEHAIVITSSSASELRSPLTHKKRVTLDFVNRSQFSTMYRVRIESDGFGVYRADRHYPSDLVKTIYLDDANIVVPPNENYSGQFIILHSKTKPKSASLTIFVNDLVFGMYRYHYDPERKAYVYDGP